MRPSSGVSPISLEKKHVLPGAGIRLLEVSMLPVRIWECGEPGPDALLAIEMFSLDIRLTNNNHLPCIDSRNIVQVTINVLEAIVIMWTRADSGRE